MTEPTEEMWIEEFKKMAKGHLGYNSDFYLVNSKKNDEQTGGGLNKIQIVEPTQQQVAQAKMQIKHDLDEEKPSKKKSKKRKLNDFKNCKVISK